MYIESGARNGSAAFYWSSSGCWMGHKAHGFMAMRDRWIGRCSPNGGITYCRDDKSAGPGTA